jgi:hypothetical protein
MARKPMPCSLIAASATRSSALHQMESSGHLHTLPDEQGKVCTTSFPERCKLD